MYKILFSIIVFYFLIQNLHAQVESDTIIFQDTAIIDSNKSILKLYPFVYYTPETSFAFGAGGIFTFYTSPSLQLNPSSISLGGYYTINNQYKITLKPLIYTKDNSFFFSLPAVYGHYLDKYFGPGPNSEELGNENFLKDAFDITLHVQAPPVLFACDRLGIIVDFNHTTITDSYKQNNELINDSLIGNDGGWNLGYGGELVWDSRDNVFFPTSGSYQFIKIVSYPTNTEQIYANVEIDVRQYHSFKNNGIFAAQFYMSVMGGEVPFYKLPALGGQYRMRGYYEGRYRDNAYMMAQLEYRKYFWKNFGFVVFTGAGNVSYDITKFSIDNIKVSYGGGLRYLFSKKENVNFRLDYGRGIGKGNSGFYFGIEEAF